MQNNFKSAFESAFLKTEAFFRRQQWKEYLIFIFFLLLSFGFWLLQSLQQDYERRIDLPLRYKNVPQEWGFSDDNPKKISILIKDKGTTLMYYSWNSNFNPVDINVPGLPRLSEYSLNISRNIIETAVSKQLISSTSILSIEPREIEIFYDSLSNRIVPVVENVSISTTPGFQISDSIKLSISEVRLFGSRKVLDTMNVVRTKLIKLDGVAKTKEITAHLDLPKGVRADNETVKVTIPVDEFTEKKMLLQVSCPDIPAGYGLRIFPSTVELTCNVPLKYFKDLTAETLGILIPFKEFEMNQTTGKIQVRLTEKPSWVISSAIVPDQLEFIIEYMKND